MGESKRMLNMHKRLEIALGDYGMIPEDSHVTVALSGGKDSSMLLHLLARKKILTHNNFKLSATLIKQGFAGDAKREAYLIELCNSLEVPFHSIDADVKPLFETLKSKSPCYTCSRSRRMNLFKTAKEIGATIIAMGHHRDDFIETLLMNLFYSSHIGTMKPNNPFFKGEFFVIRPMVYIHEYMIRAEAEELGIPSFETECGNEKTGERAHVKKIISEIYQHYPNARTSMFRALFSLEDDYLLDKPSHNSVIK